MIDALLGLPAHQRARLASALESGIVALSSSSSTLRALLGPGPELGALEEALAGLERRGLQGPAAAAWIRGLAEVEARAARPDLVWSGPEVPGLHARDTRRVYEELLGAARCSIWVS